MSLKQDTTNMSSLQTRRKQQFCTFRLDQHLFGVDILDIKEIIDEILITKIHHSQKEILGFINVRGHVHIVLDLRCLLNFEPIAINDATRIILFTSKVGESFGILVDMIEQMIEVDEQKIEFHQQEGNILDGKAQKRFNLLEIGACKLDQGLMVILDANKFLDVIKY